MSTNSTTTNTVNLWSRFTSWAQDTWKNKKAAVVTSASALLLASSLAFVGLSGSDEQDTEKTNNQGVEQTIETVTAPTITVDDGNNAALIADNKSDKEATEPVIEDVDTTMDSPEEVLELVNTLGLSEIFADEVKRLNSDNIHVASQAVKDIGHFLANGIDVEEDDALANTFFQASYDIDGNTQAAHSIGYQALHGLGMDNADLDLAEDMLTEANDNGHKLAAAHLDYLYKIK